jgi:hypothetical protein
MSTLEKKSWSSPDGTLTPDKTHAANIKFGAVTLTKANMQPGWKWSECIKPLVETESCQAGHIGVLLQGQIHVVSDDGSELTVNAGDAYRLAPGHDAWVVGDEPALGVEFSTDNKEFAAWTRGEGEFVIRFDGLLPQYRALKKAPTLCEECWGLIALQER